MVDFDGMEVFFVVDEKYVDKIGENAIDKLDDFLDGTGISVLGYRKDGGVDFSIYVDERGLAYNELTDKIRDAKYAIHSAINKLGSAK